MSRSESRCGVFTNCQADPSQASMMPCAAYEASRATPTAQASPGTAATLNRVLKFEPGAGVGVEVHLAPSKCAAVVSVASWLAADTSGSQLPTAHTSFAVTAETAPNVLSAVPSCGAGWTLQPFFEGRFLTYVIGSVGTGAGVA